MKPTKITFTGTVEFGALWDAQSWCERNGYSYGSMCRSDPIALLHGEFDIAKWCNLSAIERLKLDGKITSPDFRNGPVMVEIF